MATVQPLVLGGPMASSILVPPSQQLSSPPAFNADVSAVPGPAAGAAGSQPMTDLLGVVDPAQPTAAPPAPAPGPEVIVPVNGPNDPAASPVQATSAVGGAPRVVMTSAMNGAPAVPAPTPAPAVSEQVPKPEQQASQDWSGRPLASDSSGGGDGGVHPEEQVQPRPQPQPSPQPAQAGGPNEGQAQTGKPADQPSPANQPDDNPALSQPHLANPPVDTGADLDLGLAPSQSPAPVPVPVPAPSKRPDGAADKAAQDDFAKHWQSDSGGDSGTAKGEGSEDELKSGPGDKPETSTTRGENGKAQVTGVIVTTWTADGKVHTGTETPRGAGGGATSTGAGGASRTTVSAVTTGEAGKPSPAAATGGKNDDDEQGDALTNEEARNDEASATIAPPTPGDHPAPTSFSINPSSSYTVVTGTVTLTGQAAVSAIKAGATPLDASGGTSTKDKETGGGPGTFVIAGIVSGVVVVVLLGCWVWYRIRKKKAQNGPDSEKTDTYPDSNPNTPGPDGRRGNETDWTDSGFDFIDDPISATSTQIRHRRSTIAAYYDRNGVRQHGREHDPFDDLNAREYAEAYRGDQGRMETMYEEKEYGYGYDGGHSQQQHHVQGGYHAGNAPGAGQVWRTENPFAEPQHVHQSGYGYDSQPYDDRRTSPLQGLPTSPPDNFASAQARSRGPTPPLSSTHRSSRYPCQAPALASGKSAFDSHLHPATTNEQLGYQSRAGTQYGETATGLYGAYNRDDNAYTTADYEQEHDGRTGPYAMPLETGLPAKTPATGSLLPWLDADEARGLPPVPAGGVAGPAGPGSGRKGKKEKSKNGKGKDKKKSRGRAGEEAYENEQPMINGSERRLHPTQQAPVTNYDLVDPNQQEPFTDDQEDMPHPVRAAMAATPAVAKMQMRQRNMDEVPIPNFR